MRRSRLLVIAGAAVGVLVGVVVVPVLPTGAPPGRDRPEVRASAAGSTVASVLPPALGAASSPAPAAALAPLSASAPTPSAAGLASSLGPLLAARGLGPSGVRVLDAASGTVLLDSGGSQPRQPASTAKLLTALAALHRLGPEATTSTTVVLGAVPDELVLVGGGDLLLGPGAGDPRAVVGRAGLGDLAAQVAAARARAGATGPVRLVLDDSLTGDAPQTNPAWGRTDVASGFVAPLTSLAIDVGRTTPTRYAGRQSDPALAAAAVLAQRLGEHGVQVAGPPVRGRAPAGAAPLATVVSAPLREVVADMLAESDNTVADSVAVRVAAASGVAPTSDGSIFARSGAAVLAAVGEIGVDVSGCVMDGGSGLGSGTTATAAAMADVLALASSPRAPTGARELLAALPVVGLDGTLSGRLRGPAARGAPRGSVGPALPGAGVVRAKSGALYGVSSLAGTVVDADGRSLVFAVLADEVPGDGEARDQIDAVVSALSACGCR